MGSHRRVKVEEHTEKAVSLEVERERQEGHLAMARLSPPIPRTTCCGVHIAWLRTRRFDVGPRNGVLGGRREALL